MRPVGRDVLILCKEEVITAETLASECRTCTCMFTYMFDIWILSNKNFGAHKELSFVSYSKRVHYHFYEANRNIELSAQHSDTSIT